MKSSIFLLISHFAVLLTTANCSSPTKGGLTNGNEKVNFTAEPLNITALKTSNNLNITKVDQIVELSTSFDTTTIKDTTINQQAQEENIKTVASTPNTTVSSNILDAPTKAPVISITSDVSTTLSTPPSTQSTYTSIPITSTTESSNNSTTTTTTPPTPVPCRHFDVPSFIGGIVLTMGVMAISLVAYKFYKARNDRNYHTL